MFAKPRGKSTAKKKVATRPKQKERHLNPNSGTRIGCIDAAAEEEREVAEECDRRTEHRMRSLEETNQVLKKQLDLLTALSCVPARPTPAPPLPLPLPPPEDAPVYTDAPMYPAASPSPCRFSPVVPPAVPPTSVSLAPPTPPPPPVPAPPPALQPEHPRSYGAALACIVQLESTTREQLEHLGLWSVRSITASCRYTMGALMELGSRMFQQQQQVDDVCVALEEHRRRAKLSKRPQQRLQYQQQQQQQQSCRAAPSPFPAPSPSSLPARSLSRLSDLQWLQAKLREVDEEEREVERHNDLVRYHLEIEKRRSLEHARTLAAQGLPDTLPQVPVSLGGVGSP